MRIDHIALYVSDLEAMRAFYCEHLGAQASAKYYNPRTDFQSYFLSFSGGARLEIMTHPDATQRCPQAPRLGWIHLAFKLGSRIKVNRKTQALKAAGFTCVGEPRFTGDGYYESVFQDPEGNLFELMA